MSRRREKVLEVEKGRNGGDLKFKRVGWRGSSRLASKHWFWWGDGTLARSNV